MSSTTSHGPPAVDLHVLFTTRSLTKARTFLRSSSSSAAFSNSSSNNGVGLSRSPGNTPGGGGGSAGSALSITTEVNRRDWLGRTVLHRAVSEMENEWVQLFVGYGGTGINAVDRESGWSALHRALYVGNLAAARMLLAREDVDPALKDHEGLTPFDLYNSLIPSTNPSTSDVLPTPPSNRMDLYTWGGNQNYVLGFPSDGDRLLPERVKLRREDDTRRGVERFRGRRVVEVQMARLHTGVVTEEEDDGDGEGQGNVWVCGYGGSGRLGPTTQTQFSLTPLQSFPFACSSLSLSPDHTVLVTSSGHVYTCGLNRFSALGYMPDAPPSSVSLSSNSTNSTTTEPTQYLPKRVLGPLKKEFVLGSACSRIHTVVFTSDGLFTWGTNKGQLGYSTPGSAVQVAPRKVTLVTGEVGGVAVSEGATAVLMANGEVLLLLGEGVVRVTWPVDRMREKGRTFRPMQISGKIDIEKISSCGNTFVALSSLGDVFTFSVPPSSASSNTNFAPIPIPTPQRIWSLRRKFTAVTDVGVGLDGTVILSTVSGHVYIGTKKKGDLSSSSATSTPRKSLNGNGTSGTSTPTTSFSSTSQQYQYSKPTPYKFNRVPYLQRVIKVAANSTGAFGAIRSDVPLRGIDVEGASVPEDLGRVMPHWRRIGVGKAKGKTQRTRRKFEEGEEEEGEGEGEEEDYAERIERDVEVASRLFQVLEEWEKDPKSWEDHTAGSDVHVVSRQTDGGLSFPAHRVLLSARCAAFAALLEHESSITLDVQPITVLLLLQYLYTDDFPAIWDPRILLPLRKNGVAVGKVDVAAVKREMKHLAGRYGLHALERALESHIRAPPTPTLVNDMRALLPPFSAAADASTATSSSSSPALAGDILLQLSDLSLPCHSVLLRARCPFFETFYSDEDWSSARRNETEDGVPQPLLFDLRHLSREVMELVLRHVYADEGVEMFDTIDRPTSDEYIDFVLQVMAAANELLLDKLKLVCSAILRRFITLRNVCSILVEAAFYEASDLVRTCLEYLASSMETVLESRLLDDLPPDLIAAVSTFVQQLQGARMPISRSGMLVDDLMIKHKSWLAELDVAIQTGGVRRWKPQQPNVAHHNNSNSNGNMGPSPNLLSPSPSPQLRPRGSPRLHPRDASSPNTSPALQPLRESNEPFPMDEDFSLDGAVAAGVPHRIPMPAGTAAVIASGKGRMGSPTTASFTPLGSPPPSRLQPWSKAVPDLAQAPLDLRSIMATEASQDRRPRPVVSLDRLTSRPPASPVVSSSQPTPALSWKAPTTWRPPEPAKISLADIQSQQQQATSNRRASTSVPPGTPQKGSTTPTSSITPRRPSTIPLSASPSPIIRSVTPSTSTPGTLTPTRLPSTSRHPSYPLPSGSRLPPKSFGAADVPWTNYTIAPSSPIFDAFSPGPSGTPPHGSLTTSTFSFASIQTEQKAQLDAIKLVKAPRSFAEVMALEKEEARRKAERSAEEETAREEERAFKVWWEMEEKRVAAELRGQQIGEGARGGKRGGAGGGGGRGRGAKKSQGEGGGRGGGGGGGGAGASTSRGRGRGGPKVGVPSAV